MRAWGLEYMEAESVGVADAQQDSIFVL